MSLYAIICNRLQLLYQFKTNFNKRELYERTNHSMKHSVDYIAQNSETPFECCLYNRSEDFLKQIIMTFYKN